MPDFTTGSVDGARHQIAYRRAGSGHPLVLLHPLALSGAVWGAFAQRLAGSFDVIAADARGHGASGWDGEPFGIDDLGDDAPHTWGERAAGVLARPREQQVPFQADRWFTEGFRQRNPAEVNRVVGIFLRTDSLAHAQACRALGTMDSRGLLAKITARTLVLTGEEDYATPPAMGAAIADGVPDGEARVLPALRHLSLVEDPALAGLAAEFLSTVKARG